MRTITAVEIAIATTSTSPAPPVVARADVVVRSDSTPETPVDDALHGSRLAMVVEMIRNLTGREVKLVPPTAYLVSAPSHPAPAPPVELVVPAEITVPHAPAHVPLEVGIASILRTGTSARMTLSQGPAGGLELHAALDVDL